MFLAILGGLALFLIGTNRISAALQESAGPSARRWMAAATSSSFKALLTGTAVSTVTQSGTPTAITALGLVAGGLISAGAGLALSLGAKLGGTAAIQLAAFNVSAYALPLIGIGFVFTLWRRAGVIGGILLGAGLLFLGLNLMVGAIGELQDNQVFTMVLDAAASQGVILALIGTVLGAALGSANAAAAVAIGLFVNDAISLQTAVALVVGGNVGSTVLPLLVSRGLDTGAQRVAISHMLVKAVGGLAVVLAAEPAARLVTFIGGDEARQVANLHTLFNLAVGLVATPFAGVLVTASRSLAPTAEDDSKPKYLRADALGDPSLAIKLAQRETVRISDQVAVMMELSVGYVASGKWDPEPLSARESKIDRLTQDVVDYLARLRSSTDEENEASEKLLLASTELEHMGDQIRRLYRREEKLRREGVEFSRDGRSELAQTGALVLDRMRVGFTAFATGDAEMAQQVIDGRPAIESHVARMRLAHLARLEAQLPESRASSSHHLEVLTLLRQLDASITRMAGWALEL
jgi:phosphate:Na+ symporter